MLKSEDRLGLQQSRENQGLRVYQKADQRHGRGRITSRFIADYECERFGRRQGGVEGRLRR
jgi:hypothetical protein